MNKNIAVLEENILKTYNRMEVVFTKGEKVYLYDDNNKKYLVTKDGSVSEWTGTETPANAPKLSAGMIPVKYDTSKGKWVVCSKSDSSWYNYSTDQKQWVGQPAPEFRLQDQNGIWHELKDFRGKWLVLYFYPKDDSPGCTQEANRFKALSSQFTQSNAVVMGVRD